jgi:hypothetical protein
MVCRKCYVNISNKLSQEWDEEKDLIEKFKANKSTQVCVPSFLEGDKDKETV